MVTAVDSAVILVRDEAGGLDPVPEADNRRHKGHSMVREEDWKEAQSPCDAVDSPVPEPCHAALQDQYGLVESDRAE